MTEARPMQSPMLADAKAGRKSRLTRQLLIGMLGLFLVASLGSPWLAPYSPTEQLDSVAGRLLPPGSRMYAVQLKTGQWLLADRVSRQGEELHIQRRGRNEVLPAASVANLGPEGVTDQRLFLLGSDKFSRDVLSRLLHGARVSLFVGLASVLLMFTLGVLVGSVAALGGPLVDSLVMRSVDGLLAFPTIFLLVTLAAVIPPNPWTLVIVIAMSTWMGVARIVRGEIQTLSQQDFVLAARGLGASTPRILLRHLLPNIATPLLVEATLRIGRVILTEASLSFLGLGIQPPAASWGNMIQDGRGEMFGAWWIAGFPCLALVLTVLSISFSSDHLRALLDPRSRS